MIVMSNKKEVWISLLWKAIYDLERAISTLKQVLDEIREERDRTL